MAPTDHGFVNLFDRQTNVYIDYANARRWSERLGWRIDLQKLKLLFDSVDNIGLVRFYFGTYEGDSGSEGFIKRVQKIGFQVVTKPVKIIRLSIDASSVSENSPDILKNFISSTLLKHLKLEAIQYLNNQLRGLNRQGILYLDVPKCNFDVEIATDMRLDHHLGRVDGFCLWSGDSDFERPIRELLEDHKKVILVSTARRIASELNALRPKGLIIYEINKLRNLVQRGG